MVIDLNETYMMMMTMMMMMMTMMMMKMKMKLIITWPILKLQTPEFAWKFVWIFRTKYKSKKFIASKLAITRPILKL